MLIYCLIIDYRLKKRSNKFGKVHKLTLYSLAIRPHGDARIWKVEEKCMIWKGIFLDTGGGEGVNSNAEIWMNVELSS